MTMMKMKLTFLSVMVSFATAGRPIESMEPIGPIGPEGPIRPVEPPECPDFPAYDFEICDFPRPIDDDFCGPNKFSDFSMGFRRCICRSQSRLPIDPDRCCDCEPDQICDTREIIPRCIPTDPCRINPCHIFATCTITTPGKHKCTCNLGYEGDGLSTCKETDPCRSNPCHAQAKCTKIVLQRYRCDCNPGYVGDGRTCTAMDPCRSRPCHVQATCTRTSSDKYQCSCKQGYEGDGKSCKKCTSTLADKDRLVKTCKNHKCERNGNTLMCPYTKDFQDLTIGCGDQKSVIRSATKCDCKPCAKQTITKTIYGIASGGPSNAPLKYGTIQVNGVRKGRTGRTGNFKIEVDFTNVKIVTLTFIDRYKKFMSTDKIVNGDTPLHKIELQVQMLVCKKTKMIDTTKEATLDMGGDVPGVGVFAEIIVPPNSVVDQNGQVFTGQVTVEYTYMDTNSEDDFSLTPGTFESTQGPLISDGMFLMTITANKKKFNLKNVQISIPLTSDEEDVFWKMGKAGKWELITSEKKRRRKRQAETMVFDGEIISGVIYNIDKLSRLCYVKVKPFLSTSGTVMDDVMIKNVFKDRIGRWVSADNTVTSNGIGACIRVPCAPSGDIFALISATYKGERLRPGNVSEEITITDSDIYGHEFFDFTSQLSPKSDPEGLLHESLDPCLESPVEKYLTFYKDNEDEVMEINRIPFDEDDVWGSEVGPLHWWPLAFDESFTACYIKVEFTGTYSDDYRVVSINSGTKGSVNNQYYGTRIAKFEENGGRYAACLEFKCDGIINPDDGSEDRTHVEISISPPANSNSRCTLTQINPVLQASQNALTDVETLRQPMRTGRGVGVYYMYANHADSSVSEGIYKRPDRDIIAKEDARNRCYSSSETSLSGATTPPMVTDSGIGVTFRCT